MICLFGLCVIIQLAMPEAFEVITVHDWIALALFTLCDVELFKSLFGKR